MAGDKKTVKNRTQTLVTNHITGEVLAKEETVTYKVPKEPEYAKVYTKAFRAVVTKKGCHLPMFILLLDNMGYQNEICLTPAGRVRICEDLGIQAQTFNNHLNDLLEHDVLRRTSHGEFQANPRYVSRGTYVESCVEAYYKIERVKTKAGRAPGPKRKVVIAPDDRFPDIEVIAAGKRAGVGFAKELARSRKRK